MSVILSACRTPIGKFRGTLAALTGPQLGAVAVREALARAGLAPQQVSEVILGNVLAAGVGQAPARQAALMAGLPPTVAVLTINKVCGSGLKAIMLADQAIRAGDADAIVAGGMESMSQAPYVLPRGEPALGNRQLIDTLMHDGLTCAFSQQSMGQIAERLAADEAISREEQDAFALESHRRGVVARDQGAFQAEIVPVTVRGAKGETIVQDDEGPRADISAERLAALRAAFVEGGCVTAGNASMISDGAAAVVVASEAFASRQGLKPLARIVATATAGSEPTDLFIAPVDALRQALEKAHLSPAHIDLWEINEAFASQMLACLRRLEVSHERVNVHGGAIALGHPIGASGARVITTLLYALQQRGGRYGAASLCLGGGNAVAAVVEIA